MRIIAGSAGRTPIKVPGSVTRPTTDFVRQAIFSILGEKIMNARVLDLFAGSGALGLEALSRGAASCTFVDQQRQATTIIQQNLTKSKLEGGRIVNADVLSFLSREQQTYDVIFSDPPYWKHHGDVDWIDRLISKNAISPRLAPDGCWVVEMSTYQKTPETAGMQLLHRREYGSSAVLIFSLLDDSAL
ncbi:MAG: 16S rRNA (guanine(966)-N(2))-methyltransferase RsmD [Verrucomicrobia bacterium]|nr:MAG: 16S rRNA (guanine(966)-N(2))-methyltransferase RsmD [Verrucomicrobiota bacterium]